MPISTPEHLVPKYSGDKDHFFHVLEHLFVPAVGKNKFNAVRPIAEGSDVIHAEIIKNLEKADLVLCDASSLNANVFYELGIRTALDKPVCIVRDELTPKIPFDTTIINHLVYDSSLAAWTLEKQIDDLATHIKKSFDRSEGKNKLWKYFGLSTRATLPHENNSVEGKLELLSLQVEGLNRKMSERQELAMPGLLEEMKKKINRPDKEFKKDAIVRALSEHAIKFKIPISNTTWVSDKLLLVTVDTYPLPSQEEVLLKNFGSEHGIEIDTVPF
jgi:hypothetical protein